MRVEGGQNLGEPAVAVAVVVVGEVVGQVVPIMLQGITPTIL